MCYGMYRMEIDAFHSYLLFYGTKNNMTVVVGCFYSNE
jgi:uncharacterized membrane protein